MRVQLDDDLALDEAQRVASGAVHLRHAPERQRILEEASRSGLPERAPVEQRVEPRERLAEAVRAPRDRDLGMQRADVAAERLEVERSRRVDPAHEPARVVDRERSLSGRIRVADQERQSPRLLRAPSSPSTPWARSAFCARSAWPTVPSELTRGRSLSFNART